MPTRAGWWVLLAAVGLALTGRALGAIELYVLAAGAGLLVVGAVLFVRLRRLRLEVAREIHPLRIQAGHAARVEVRATNLGRARTPLLRLRDPVTGTRGALLTLAPLPRDGTARAAYRLPSSRRGLVRVGPLTVEITDPFGLASVTAPAASLLDVTVYPRTEPLVPPAQAGGRDPHAGAEHPSFAPRAGEDFHTLRPYVVGDDLRRVHWPSTARTDELMVRQDEIPWQGRATVVLDTRRNGFDEARFEEAVSAAASLVAACTRRRDLIRLVTTDGADSGVASGHAHVDAILEHLATVELSGGGSLRRTVEALDATRGAGTLVVVLGHATPADLAALARLRRRFAAVWAVVFPRPGMPLGATPPARDLPVLVVPPGTPFGPMWTAYAGGSALVRGGGAA